MRTIVALLLCAATAQAAWQMKVKKGGKTTVTGDAETMAEHDRSENAKEAFRKDVAAAPRRAPSEPIALVIVESPSADENLKRANKMLADELKRDPILKVSVSAKEAGGEVYARTTLGTEAALGRNAKGKAVVGKAIALKADVLSAYEPEIKKAKELGNILQTGQMVKDLAKKIAGIAKDEFGPNLPSPAAVAALRKKHTGGSIAEQAGIEPGDDPKAALKKLFKPRKR